METIESVGCKTNESTLVRLANGTTAYPANEIQLYEGMSRFVVAEAPRSGGVDDELYYEMAFLKDPGALISVVQPYKWVGKDRERQDHLSETNFLNIGQSKSFCMQDGKDIRVECSESRLEGTPAIYEVRTLKFTSGGTTRDVEQWLFYGPGTDEGTSRVFSYDSSDNGMYAAKMFYDKVKETGKPVAAIVNCITGKDRSAALIMWMSLFELLDMRAISVEGITLDYLKEVAKEFEKQSTAGALVDHVNDTLPRYYSTDALLQAAIREVLAS